MSTFGKLDAPLPSPAEVTNILIWHQGALGDLLLAGPALAALSRHYAGARITALGHPERWGLLQENLPLAEVWDSSASRWSRLFGEGELPEAMRRALARFQLALVFSPRPSAALLACCRQSGIANVHWLPSFADTGIEAVSALQARHLQALGLSYVPRPFELATPASCEAVPELPGPGPWLALAPGSGHPLKNWPLAHYYEVSRALSWEYGLSVVWLAGPAEAEIMPYLEGLARAQGQIVLADRPLALVARVLGRSRLYIGNDSGLTHLAVAVAGPEVIALFGPTDPRIWAPLGPRVFTLTGPCPQAPCAAGRRITCPEPGCLKDLAPETVLAAAAPRLSSGSRPVGDDG